MIKRLILIVSILFTVITSAQEGTSSPYSFYGIGLTTFEGTVENRSMGGLSIFSDSIHINLQNPAGYGELALTTYTLGGTHSMISTKSDTDKEYSNVTSLDYIAIGIPTGKFGFGFGLMPYTSVGYNLINVNEEEGTAARFEGSGGLNKVFLGAGFKINKNFSLGAGVDYNFGTIQNKNLHLREGVQYGTREINQSKLSGFSFNFGVNYQQMLSEGLQIRAGATYIPESKLSSENMRELALVAFSNSGGELIGDRRDIPVENTEYTLPAKFTFGSGIGQPRKWFLGLEYSNREAANFNNRSFALKGATYTSASTYIIGGFYIPDYSSLTSYFSRIVYRGGFRMEETGLSLQGEPIKEFGISFGVGLPVKGFSNINLGIEYGQRGTTSSDLIQEDFLNLSISLSLNDKWFLQRKFK
ncbi:MAG TPA: hypothetical protein VFI78_05760 [Salinimicrobium sp.]|nr:hypothetical protein [Salinimicrobium sp.]